MPQVLANLGAPPGENEQVVRPTRAARLLDEEGTPARQLHVARAHESQVLGFIFEQENLNNRVRFRQLQLLADLLTKIAQLLKDRQVLFEREIAVKDKLR